MRRRRAGAQPPEPRSAARGARRDEPESGGQGYYGSGGSYGYGGGFDDRDQRRRVHHEDEEHGYAQDAGYRQSGGYRDQRAAEPYERYGSFDGYEESEFARRSGGPVENPRHPMRRGQYYGMAPHGYTRSDDRIREDICDHLMHGHVDPRNIQVRVERGEVTLEGQVPSRRDKYIVEEIVVSVLGVHDVDNRLRVPRQELPLGRERGEGDGGGRSSRPRSHN